MRGRMWKRTVDGEPLVQILGLGQFHGSLEVSTSECGLGVLVELVALASLGVALLGLEGLALASKVPFATDKQTREKRVSVFLLSFSRLSRVSLSLPLVCRACLSRRGPAAPDGRVAGGFGGLLEKTQDKRRKRVEKGQGANLSMLTTFAIFCCGVCFARRGSACEAAGVVVCCVWRPANGRRTTTTRKAGKEQINE